MTDGCCTLTDVTGDAAEEADVAGEDAALADVSGDESGVTDSWAACECLQLDEAWGLSFILVATDELILTEFPGIYGGSDDITFSESDTFSFGKVVGESVTLSEAVVKTFAPGAVAEAIALSEAAVKTPRKVGTDTLTLSEAAVKSGRKATAESMTFGEALRQHFGDLGFGTNPAGFGGN
jgi:hypothetical protein